MALVDGAGAAPAGSAYATEPPGVSGVTARPNYVGPSGNRLVKQMNAGRKPRGIKGVRMGSPVCVQKAVLRSKENAAVERREARWSALWAGSSLPLEGQVRSQDGPTGAAFRAREFRRSASLYWECEGFETDNLER